MQVAQYYYHMLQKFNLNLWMQIIFWKKQIQMQKVIVSVLKISKGKHNI